MVESKNGKSRQGKGGGPKTKAGKAKVARNAVKHGITSPIPVIPEMEIKEEWLAHLEGIIESLEPEGRLETVLAERIASLFWRFTRVIRYETAVTARMVAYEGFGVAASEGFGVAASDVDEHDAAGDAAPDDQLSESDVIEAETNLVPTSFHLDRIMRYESHIHRQLMQTYNLFEAVEARRLGRPTHVTRLDISSSPQFRNTRAPALSDALANLK